MKGKDFNSLSQMMSDKKEKVCDYVHENVSSLSELRDIITSDTLYECIKNLYLDKKPYRQMIATFLNMVITNKLSIFTMSNKQLQKVFISDPNVTCKDFLRSINGKINHPKLQYPATNARNNILEFLCSLEENGSKGFASIYVVDNPDLKKQLEQMESKDFYNNQYIRVKTRQIEYKKKLLSQDLSGNNDQLTKDIAKIQRDIYKIV